MRIKPKSIWEVIVKTAKGWVASDPFRESAVISYYAIFSIPGLLIIVIWVAGIFFGQEAVQGEIGNQIEGIAGSEAAEGVQNLVKNATLDHSSFVMKVIGILTLIFGATTLFFQLQKSLNNIWEVEPAPSNNIKKFIYDRASSLSLILVIAFLLLITLVLSALISVVSGWIERNFGEYLLYLVQVVNFIISVGVVTCLFAVMFKVLPDVEIGWRSVWVGALVTALLFTVGKTLLGLYFGIANPTSGYGAAGTVILIILWVNYTCLILFFGAEFTQVYARRYSHKIEPSKHANWSANYILHQQQMKEAEEEEQQNEEEKQDNGSK